MLQPHHPMKCSNCQSQRVVTGAVIDSWRRGLTFAPGGLRSLSFPMTYGTKVESFACLGCGHVWFATSAEELEAFVRKHCDQKID
jgi:hypothetical protein